MVMLGVLLLAGGPAAGQGRWSAETPTLPMAKTWLAYKAKGLPPYRPPRTPDGVPDLQGDWGEPGGAGGDDIEEHEYVDSTTPPQESFVADPPDGKIPYTPWALAKQQEHRAGLARGWPGETGQRLHADPASFCFTTIGPRGSGGVEIIQRPGSVIMIAPNKHRVIPTDGRPHSKNPDPTFNGESIGHWEGDTLVVDTIAIDERMRNISVGRSGDANAWTHSKEERVIERFTRNSKNYLTYQLTVIDPVVLEKPFTSAPHTWTLAQSPSDVWTEYHCTANEEPFHYQNLSPEFRKQYETQGVQGQP